MCVRVSSRTLPSVLALAAAIAPGTGHALSVLNAPPPGARTVPVVLDRDAGLRWHAEDDALPPRAGSGDAAGTYGGAAFDCGDPRGPEILYIDMQRPTLPEPSATADAEAVLDGAAPVGTDRAERSPFLVILPDDVPLDRFDAIGVRLVPGPDERAPEAQPGRVAMRTAVDPVERDPLANLPALANLFGDALGPVDAEGGQAPTAARVVPVAYVAPARPQATNGAGIGPDGFLPASGVESGTVGADSVILAAMAERPNDPVFAGAMPQDVDLTDTVWLYPIASPGYLQEIDRKSDITFTSFRAPVAVALDAIDCYTPVGADIAELVQPFLDGPFLPANGPAVPLVPAAAPLIPVGSDVSTAGTPSAPGVPVARRASPFSTGAPNPFFNGTRTPSANTPIFPGSFPSTADTPDDTSATAVQPSPVPLPGTFLLYLAALAVGAWHLRFTRKGDPA